MDPAGAPASANLATRTGGGLADEATITAAARSIANGFGQVLPPAAVSAEQWAARIHVASQSLDPVGWRGDRSSSSGADDLGLGIFFSGIKAALGNRTGPAVA